MESLALKEFLAQDLHGGKRGLHKLASGPEENKSLLLMVRNRGGPRCLQQPAVMAADDTRKAIGMVGWHRVATNSKVLLLSFLFKHDFFLLTFDYVPV